MSLEAMVQQFNETFKPKDTSKIPVLPDPDAQELFGSLILEELQELAIAFDKVMLLGDKDHPELTQEDVKAEIFDAIVDIIYVTAQQAHMHGYPVEAGLREVHRSNMSKLDEEGLPIIRDDGKVLKGPGFSEPDLNKVLKEHKGV